MSPRRPVTSQRPKHRQETRYGHGRTSHRRWPPHLAPIDEKSFFYRGGLSTRRAWHAGDTPPAVVWGAGDLVSNMIAVLERRLVEASIRGLEDKPLASATVARLVDVAAFLAGDFDDARCAALLAGLVWARPAHTCERRTPPPAARQCRSRTLL